MGYKENKRRRNRKNHLKCEKFGKYVLFASHLPLTSLSSFLSVSIIKNFFFSKIFINNKNMKKGGSRE